MSCSYVRFQIMTNTALEYRSTTPFNLTYRLIFVNVVSKNLTGFVWCLPILKFKLYVTQVLNVVTSVSGIHGTHQQTVGVRQTEKYNDDDP